MRFTSNVQALRLLLLSLATLFGGPSRSDDSPRSIVIGERHELDSKVMGEVRTYFLHKPPLYEQGTERYPLLIVLDPETQFHYATAAADFLAQAGRIPALLVVGVVTANRTRDLGPPGPAGAADTTLAFIADELIPAIDRSYRTRPYRVLSGHSRGGYFTIYALQKRPESFNAYIATSPSLPLDNEALVKAMDPFLSTRRELRADLYLSIGNEGRNMLGAVSRLAGALSDKAPRTLRWHFDRRPQETHFSNALPGLYEGLQRIFDGWYIADPLASCEHGGYECLTAHYERVSQHMGYTVPVPASAVMDAGSLSGLVFGLTRQGKFIEAEAVLSKALAANPTDAVLRGGAVTFYTSIKQDRPLALEHAKHLLEIDPGSEAARQVLKGE